jgi:ATP-dependent DNA helicase RecG
MAMRGGGTGTAAVWPPDGPLSMLPGVGPVTEQRLARAGLASLLDLLRWFPRRCRELRELQAPDASALGELVRIRGAVRQARLQWLPGRRAMVTIEFEAGDGTPFQAAFFNQPWLKKAYAPGAQRTLEGVLEHKGRRFALRGARVLPAGVAPPGGLQLRYPEIEGVSPSRLQQWIALALERVDLQRWQLPPLPPGLPAADAEPSALLVAMHRPDDLAAHETARRHFAVREAVELFSAVERARRRREGRPGRAFPTDARIAERIAARIPFALTADQAAAVRQLQERLAGPAPMGVLLQGDVGTGKTAVAVAAALTVLAHGAQVAFLAPTELLAEQHHAEVARWLQGSGVKVVLLTASVGPGERKRNEHQLRAGGAQLVFGTHALLSERTAFAALGLVIVDEQHRFGVAQRMQLVHKGTDPHVLVMTATPIPRTLALTLFGDLDAIVLRERPGGRRAPRARYLPGSRWPRVLAAIRRRVERTFVVCPAVGADGAKGGAVRLHQELAREFRTGVVHGRMPVAERQAALQAFRDGVWDVLVGTTVLEVGVDVPEATLMVVVAAEQFGLATLHQLRGRVGRGPRPGLCLLCGTRTERVAAVCRTADGFELAEADLRIRGSGELLGTEQSGFGELRALDPIDDLELLQRARAAVRGEP